MDSLDGDNSPTVQHTTTRQPRFDGEDVSPTTARELRGFYAYGVAAEIFAVCGVGSFLPVTLEQLAREKGVLWSDKTTSCVAKKVAEHGEAAVRHLVTRGANSTDNQCVVRVYGAEMTTPSFAMYTFSVAVFVQALALVSFSGVADRGSYRKRLLLGFGLTGSISSMIFILVTPDFFLFAPLLVIVGVVCLGSSFVALNSFLPLLVANHPEVDGDDEINPDDTVINSSLPHSSLALRSYSPSLSADQVQPSDSSSLKVSNAISSRGVGLGYAGAVVVQLLSILLLFSLSKIPVSATLPLRLVLLLVGACWFTFTIPAYFWLRDRPGPPLKTLQRGKIRSCLDHVWFSWVSVWRTMRTVRRLPQVLLFLLAWFLLSDAIATVSGTAILFARTELKMDTVAIALLSIIVTISGILGAFVWPTISHRFALRTNRTIVACILLMEIIPLYGLTGYIPIVRSWGIGGLQQAWEIYPLGIIHGLVMGGLSSYCRSVFGLLIPPGNEAAFYSLYAITDKGSSAIGPAIVGRIVDVTGEIRPAFAFLSILIAIPGPLIWLVDVEKGHRNAREVSMKTRRHNNFHTRDEQRDSNSLEGQGLMHDHE